MADQLIIYLKDIHKLEADWAFFRNTGELSTPVDTGTLAELADKNKNAIASADKIYCIINAQLTHFSYQTIPAKNIQRALQAIPFALEDQLAEDIELMHFATSPASHNIYPVAAIKHQTLQQITTSLSELEIEADCIYTDALCLPRTANSWRFLHSGDSISIDQGNNTIIHSDPDMFELILKQLIQQTKAENIPASFEVFTNKNLPDEIIRTDELPASIEINRHQFSSAIALFAANLSGKHQVNLLQGKYQVQKTTHQWWKPWLLAASLAVIVICLQLLSGILELSKFSQENTLLNHEINSIYKRSFPASKKIINARVQMESKLKALQKNMGKADSGFIDILADIAPVVSANNLTIKAINYRNRKFELQITTDKLSSAEKLMTDFNKLTSVKAELVSSSSESKQVTAKIQLEAI
ncbi:MAG: type II secretion system protein GspL [Gammaproteobacteria bacterium]|nr:type II secretion system protein GspL [Gammaproteobacteria bacterium]